MIKRPKHKRLIFIIFILLLSLLSLFFVISNFRDNIVFFYSPTELLELKDNNRVIRIGGLVKENSIKKIDALNVEFIVTDLKNEVKIHYSGLLPDLFREKQGVVAKGKYDRLNHQFISRELLIKHDENYMPPEVADALKK